MGVVSQKIAQSKNSRRDMHRHIKTNALNAKHYCFIKKLSRPFPVDLPHIFAVNLQFWYSESIIEQLLTSFVHFKKFQTAPCRTTMSFYLSNFLLSYLSKANRSIILSENAGYKAQSNPGKKCDIQLPAKFIDSHSLLWSSVLFDITSTFQAI